MGIASRRLSYRASVPSRESDADPTEAAVLVETPTFLAEPPASLSSKRVLYLAKGR